MNMQLPQAINTTDDEIDLSELFSVLWHKKWLIIFITLSCFAFALVVIERMPNVYRSTATVLLHNEGDNNALKALLPTVLISIRQSGYLHQNVFLGR